jgi:sugar O-acyltransferase (sialic acid O-acetyltransferase NeuD family)
VTEGLGRTELLIVGAGGHARELLWLVSRLSSRYECARVAVESGWEIRSELAGVTVECLDDIEPTLAGIDYVVAIGNSGARERIAVRLDSLGARPAVLIDPSVQRPDRMQIRPGAVICAGCVLTCDIEIGRHVHINAGCLVHHDALIGDFTTLSPGVRVAGHVEIGPHAFIGIGATIINGRAGQPLRIGEGSVVAAGAVVTKDVPPGSMVAGVPAQRMR